MYTVDFAILSKKFTSIILYPVTIHVSTSLICKLYLSMYIPHSLFFVYLLYRSIYYKPHSSLFVYSTFPNITYLTVTSIFVYFTCKNIMYLTVRYCILYLHVHILHTSQLVARAAPWMQFLSFLSSFLRSRFLGVRM